MALILLLRKPTKSKQNRIRIGIRQMLYSGLAQEFGVCLTKVSTVYILKEQIAGPKKSTTPSRNLLDILHVLGFWVLSLYRRPIKLVQKRIFLLQVKVSHMFFLHYYKIMKYKLALFTEGNKIIFEA
jgi:hypothetical protein